MPPTATDQQLASEIHDLRKDFHDFRVEIVDKLGAINTNLEGFKGRVETQLAVARWIAGASTPIILGLLAWAFTATQRATHIEDSVAALRDVAKEQDERIARLIDLQQGAKITMPPPGEQKHQN